MKLRYILVSLAAALTFAVACEKEADHYLDEVQLSSSFLSVPLSGGSASATISTTSNWTVVEAPDWVSVSPVSGSAGSSTITLTADVAEFGRVGSVKISCADKFQYINITQGVAGTEAATCAEVLAGPEGKSYRVTGVCTSIANTSYGNWYIDDGTGSVYIYGTVDSQGNYNWSSFNIEVGDVVTVEGPKTLYNGTTVELVDATFISVKKSLIKIDSNASSFESDGGEFAVKVAYKGSGAFFEILNGAKDWIQYVDVEYTPGEVTIYEPNPADTAVFRFNVAQNTKDARTGVIEFSSSSGSNTSVLTYTVSQKGLSGTLANPYSVADAIAYCQTLSGNSGNEFYVKGKISRIISGGEFGSYGNATFFISDDGEYLGEDDRNCDKTHDFEAYRVLFLGNQKWVQGDPQIAVGDEVIICGILTIYNGISETASGKAYIYSINGVTSGENGLGNINAPFNVAGAAACIDAGFTGNVYVKGIVSEIVNNGQFGAQFGNGTFWISDDGEKYGDSSKDFEAYRVLWLGNRKWVEGDDLIAVGDEVILHGALTKYGSTYETSSGKAYVYSVNGKTE